jgi:DNA-binding NarL/FixJ family response regulator
MDNGEDPIKDIKRILIIDDQILFREGLVGLLSTINDFEVVGCVGSVSEGKAMAILHKPDIILMDFSLPDGTGLEATREILKQLPNCKIIFLTVTDCEQILFEALRLGAMGYLLKNINCSDLISSLKALDRGEKAISRKMTSRVLDEFTRSFSRFECNMDNNEVLKKLSHREMDVLREMESGASNHEIAQCLCLSVNTVKHHISSIFTKLDVKNRREAIIFTRHNVLTQYYPYEKE